ncbi:glycoside hydrolase family 32 protein [Microbacterium sp. SORGH_AS_0888]|uniref:glycoside hydrolase family 32 protein n=1 Tax=Microbacterium sp. SORGH_AS_0888 TaxID=3041791 RepID=UPI0027813CF8|nr:glycoside hydrolase family 32 protein [Microbacterium sp. SORGH_AS_0888]MDQ1130080.1 fructan beta-fructosidase [Microbacterium sp. SORGH_AS_0888]
MNAVRPCAIPAVRTRPVAHLTAHDTWLNDPNGLVYVDGVYHAYYQNNPLGTAWGNMSWGHATSTNLTDWTEHETAILFTEDEQIFSGSVVVDKANTAGFAGAGQVALVAIYTSVRSGDVGRSERQAQALAYSLDGGMRWTKYPHNPVLDVGSDAFRDPKVFWHGDTQAGRWVMVAVEATDHRVVLYTSTDLIHWEFASDFGPAHACGGVWECPDLFPLVVDGSRETKWVLVVSLNPGGIAGGSGTQYFIGDFDGRTFVPDRLSTSASLETFDWLDYGPDYYAAVSFSNVPEDRRLTLGWMNNWEYAEATPTFPWRSALTLVRELSMSGSPGSYVLRQRPVLPSHIDGLTIVRLRVSTESTSHSVVEIGDGDAAALTFTFDGRARQIRIVRTDAHGGDFRAGFARQYDAPLPRGQNGLTDVLFVIDATSVEVFVDDGAVTLTQQIFPRAPLTHVAVDGDANVHG